MAVDSPPLDQLLASQAEVTKLIRELIKQMAATKVTQDNTVAATNSKAIVVHPEPFTSGSASSSTLHSGLVLKAHP